MNRIEVIAIGSPNSFARQIQERPEIAIELLRNYRKVIEDNFKNGYIDLLDARLALDRHKEAIGEV